MGRDAGGFVWRRPLHPHWLLVAGAILILGSGIQMADHGFGRDGGARDAAGVSQADARQAAELAVPVPVAPQEVTPVVVPDPARIRIPVIGVDAPVIRLALNADGTLAVPEKWEEVGWYEQGTAPGAVGPAVMVGHYDSTTGPAVFYRLRELKVGDQIEVASPTGVTTTFTVYRTEQAPKSGFPTERVYGAVDRPELRLITCGGAFDYDTDHYLDNLIVYAYGNGGPPPSAAAPAPSAPAPSAPASRVAGPVSAEPVPVEPAEPEPALLAA